MRITESRIRRIIREELEKQVDEMAYAGSLGIRHAPEDPDESGFDYVPNRKGAERYARSGRFRTLAEKHYANIPFPVWVAPMIGKGAGVDLGRRPTPRITVQDLNPDGIQKLQDLGYSIPEDLDSDGLVILYTAITTGRWTMATPWMIFHSIFDSNSDIVGELSPSFTEIFDYLSGDIDFDARPDLMPLEDTGDFIVPWRVALTMKSAREGTVTTSGDAFTEMVCQELLTSGGLRVNYDKVDEETADAIRIIADHAKRAAAEFRRNARGKLITVAVS